jgi:two-component system, cell cycle response regulator DivK
MEAKRILIAEDSSVIQNLIRKVLEQQQYEVHTAKNGKQVLEKIAEKPYALLLLDISMPVLDGIDTTIAIRQMQGANGEIPIFAITGNAGNLKEEEFIKIGFNEVLQKPIDYDLLVELVGAYMTRRVR